ncbi:MAG: hypothetical protein IK083_07415 [Abditibacteriota bacterium]|nr:hypothetical protein [Abditibacteriota bacterium]
MRQKIGLLWLLPVLIALLLPAAAGAVTITTVDELLALGGTTINEDVSLDGVFDLTGRDWTPITEIAEGVCFDGSAATIMGLDMSAISDDGDYAGLVAVNRGQIAGLNVILSGEFSNTALYSGVIAGFNEETGEIIDCIVSGDPASGEVILANTRAGGSLGGIVGTNDGAISRALVNDLTFTDGNGVSSLGGIAGTNQYQIIYCFADAVKLVGNTADSRLGGIAGSLTGNTAERHSADIMFSTVTCSSLSGRGFVMGGLAGMAMYGEAIGCRVNYVDIAHSGTENCYLGGLIGGVLDFSDTYRSYIATSYYADRYLSGMSWEDHDFAGGIVGGCSVQSSAIVFFRCFYCTDYCAAPMVGVNEGQSYSGTFDICDGVSKITMTAPDWAAENLLDPWKNTGPDNYPVFDDRIITSFSRLHRGGSYLPFQSATLLWKGQDVNTLGMVNADTEFDPADFELLSENTNLELEYVTVNGARLSEPITAGDYGRLNFSGVVDNAFCRDELQPAVDEGNEIYDAGLGVYNFTTLFELKDALEEAEEAMSESYLFIDEEWGSRLLKNIQGIEYEYFIYNVFLIGDNASTYVNDSSEEVFSGFMGDTVRLNAIPARGYKFICWKDSAGNILSEEPEFEYTISRTTSLEAVAAPLEACSFIYKDSYGKVYKTDAVTDYSELDYPVAAGQAGLRTGYTVREWQNDYPGVLPTSGTVTQDVTFTAILQKADTTFTVRATAAGEETVKQLKAAAVFSVTAPDEYEDEEFSYWQDDNTGRIASYNAKLSVSVYANMSFTAVYGEAVDDYTLVNLWEPSVEGSKIAFTGQVQTGSDFVSEVMHGVLLLKSDTPVDSLLFDTPGVIVGKSSGYSAQTKTFIINKKNVDQGDTWYGRAFIVYINDLGIRDVAYSPIKCATRPAGNNQAPFSMDEPPSLPGLGD